MAAAVERLMNVIMTIGSRRRIDRARLQAVIPDYRHASSPEAFERMFERDKAEILELGFPLRSERDDWEDITYYWIDAPAVNSPLDLTDAEYTVVLAASRAWDDAAAGGVARRLRAKLLSLGHVAEPDLLQRTPRGHIESLAVLSPLLEAVTTQRSVSFAYRTSQGALSERSIEPWLVGVWQGHWYVYGFDLERSAPRLFRASRIESFPRRGVQAQHERPSRLDLAEIVGTIDSSSDQAAATVMVEPFKAQALRELAYPPAPLAASEITLPLLPRPAVIRRVLADARWATLLTPAQWREEVAHILAEIIALHEAPAHLEWISESVDVPFPTFRTPTTSPDRLSRLVALASYVMSRGEVEIAELASEFALTAKQVNADLELLFLCGDLGAGFEDLIDVQWEGSTVRVLNAAPLRRGLTLSAAETTALLAGLAALEPAAGAQTPALRSARAKLLAAGGHPGHAPEGSMRELDEDRSTAPDPADGGNHERVDEDPSAHSSRLRSAALAAVQEAISRSEPVTIRYSSPAKAGTTVRRIHPSAISTSGAHTYVHSWCELAHDHRDFRVDRIVEILPPGTPSEAPTGSDRSADTPDLSGRVQADVWLRLEGPAHWIAEAFDAQERREYSLADGEPRTIVRLPKPVRYALVDAVLEAAGSAEVLEPAEVRNEIVTTTRLAHARFAELKELG